MKIWLKILIFTLIGLFISIIFSLFLGQIGFLFLPFLMLPVFFINIINELIQGRLPNLLNETYFWTFTDNNLLKFLILIILTSLFYFFMSFIFLKRSDKIKKGISIFLFIFYFMAVLSDFISWLKGYFAKSPVINVSVGPSFEHLIILSIIIIISILFLSRYNKNITLKYLSLNLLQYFFFLIEILLVLFIGIIFINWINTKTIDLISAILSIIITGFFIFFVIKISKNKIKSLIAKKNHSQ